MKAVLTDQRPAGDEWVFERKLDGIRCLAVKDGGATRLYSRNELSLTDRYAPLAARWTPIPPTGSCSTGEAVTFVDGRDRFGGGDGRRALLYVFDVLFAGGATCGRCRSRSGGRCSRACCAGATRCA
jgi:ATP-dependent DNA ligase